MDITAILIAAVGIVATFVSGLVGVRYGAKLTRESATENRRTEVANAKHILGYTLIHRLAGLPQEGEDHSVYADKKKGSGRLMVELSPSEWEIARIAATEDPLVFKDCQTFDVDLRNLNIILRHEMSDKEAHAIKSQHPGFPDVVTDLVIEAKRAQRWMEIAALARSRGMDLAVRLLSEKVVIARMAELDFGTVMPRNKH